MTEEIKYLGEVQKLSLGPNDVLVLSIDGRISPEAAESIRKTVRDVLGEGQKCMILCNGMKVGVLEAA